MKRAGAILRHKFAVNGAQQASIGRRSGRHASGQSLSIGLSSTRAAIG
jgi:hypothetical protein